MKNLDPLSNRPSPHEGTHEAPARGEIIEQVKELLCHLERIGVTHLPSVDPQRAIEDFAQLCPPSPQRVSSAQQQASVQTPPQPPAPGHRTKTEPAAVPSDSRIASPTGATGVTSMRAYAPVPPPRQRGPLDPIVVAAADPPTNPLGASEKRMRLADCAAQVAACTRCAELAGTRKKTVFGEGSLEPRIVFFGEAPGAEEDREGRPFVGKAGQLLTKMIEACTLRREEVYILNTIKCRPPGNRNPTPEEVANCRPFFEQQLRLLQPQYIVCLGAVSTSALLRTTLSIGQLRGVFHHYQGTKVLVTYHPAYLLRNPDAKRLAWQDLQFLMRDMGIEPSGRSSAGG